MSQATTLATQSGKMLDLEDPRADQITIDDIAHALSVMPRYAGQCDMGGHPHYPLSVAQHSICVARMLPPELQMVGLLHDATEAYLCDVPGPAKVLLPGYVTLERKLWVCIAAKFGLPDVIPNEVQEIDLFVRRAEMAHRFHAHPQFAEGFTQEIPEGIKGYWPGRLAYQRFLSAYFELTKVQASPSGDAAPQKIPFGQVGHYPEEALGIGTAWPEISAGEIRAGEAAHQAAEGPQ